MCVLKENQHQELSRESRWAGHVTCMELEAPANTAVLVPMHLFIKIAVVIGYGLGVHAYKWFWQGSVQAE